MYNQVYKFFEPTDLELVLSWGDICVVYQLVDSVQIFISFLSIVNSLFEGSVSKLKSMFTFMCTIRFTSCLNQPIE